MDKKTKKMLSPKYPFKAKVPDLESFPIFAALTNYT